MTERSSKRVFSPHQAFKYAYHTIGRLPGGVFWLPVALGGISFLLISQPATWLTLTIAGLAMGLMIFLMASGLSLVFGLMDVLNFGHSAFISFGAFIAASILSWHAGWLQADSVLLNGAALFLALLGAVSFACIAGWFFETVIIKPVYKDHLRQILITMGALIVCEQLILVVWGGIPLTVPRPAFLQGSVLLGQVPIEVYRLFALLMGLVIYAGLYWLFNATRAGLLVRAGVENREMVEALGYRIDRLFLAVFIGGSALAALGGAIWAGYETMISPALGTEMMTLVFIVVIIGGPGSIQGTLLGALLVGLTGNYLGYLAPKMALATNMLLMLSVLLWRPNGLKPVAS
ncbi:branched-chain amino acid ABC transporter permease [Polycladidibacter stylochi]|uniref:branched-chain amino acid ABC transporter permease n=1 Tax=Polycladidibacter stylochi TaxID=1807766 RepID=UPI0009EAADCD|nr:branched-chain amino acid ABC transporter permease [Pseudovibrio stylochi]